MKYYMTIFVFLSFILAGCSQETSTQQKEESKEKTQQQVKNAKEEGKKEKKDPELSYEEKREIILNFFQNEVGTATKLEVEALQSITTSSGGIQSSHSIISTETVNQKIPDYEAALTQMKGIEPKIPELERLTEQMLLASEIYYEVLELQKKGIEKQNLSLLQKANEKLTEYLMVVEDYHFEMEELKQKYKLEDVSNS